MNIDAKKLETDSLSVDRRVLPPERIAPNQLERLTHGFPAGELTIVATGSGRSLLADPAGTTPPRSNSAES